MAERADLTDEREKNEAVNSDDPEQIREQIEETREELSETIDALQEKLSVENITDQVTERVSEKTSELYQMAKDTVYNATVKKAGDFMNNVGREIEKTGILKTATENPLPLFFLALGAGLLVFNNSKSKNGAGNHRRRLSGGTNDRSMLENAQNKIGNAAEDAYDSAGNLIGSAYDTVGSVAGDAMDKVGNLGSTAREQYDYQINENPLTVGIVALALGAVIGMAIPTTSYEDELMGEARENLVSKAQNAARDTVRNVKNVAQETIGSVTDDAAEKARQVAENAADTVGKEAKKQNLV